MPKYRKLLILALLLAVAGTLAFLLYRRAAGPPEAARLLPEGDRLAYLNLKPVRLFWDLSKSKPLELEGNYQDFVDQTGIQFERDMDEIAVSWQEARTAGDHDVESAAVFTGRFDQAKLNAYLKKVSSQAETYGGLTIYTIPNQDHNVRVCVLDRSRVATSTRGSAEAIHGIIDRLRGSAGGPWLLQTYYRNVPTTSLAWMIDRVRTSSRTREQTLLPSFSFLDNTVAVGSLRYNGSLLVRADVFAVSDADAKRVFDSTNTFLALSGFLGRSTGMRDDADVKAALNSIRVEQKGNVVTITGECSERLLKKIQNEMKTETGTLPPAGNPQETGKR
jgi:hypothetical protein